MKLWVLLVSFLVVLAGERASSHVEEVRSCKAVLRSVHGEAFSTIPMSPERLSAKKEGYFGEVAQFNDQLLFDYSLGGTLRVLESPTGRWLSDASVEGSRIGDPHSLLIILGAKAGEALGFHALSANTLTVPDGVALAAAVRKLNLELALRNESPIALSFYEVDLSRPLLGREYLQRFVNGEIPIERSGQTAIHDISFHSTEILLPDWVVRRSQRNAAFVLKFIETLQKNGSALQSAKFSKFLRLSSTPEFEIAKVSEKIISAANTRIDLLGNLAPALLLGERFKSFSSSMTAAQYKRVVRAAGVDQSPQEFLREILESMDAPKSVRADFNRFAAREKIPREIIDESVDEKIDNLLNDMSFRIEQLRALLEAF